MYIKSRVKQKNQRSGFLLSLALDPLLLSLQSKDYCINPSASLTPLEYTNDLVLISASGDGINKKIRVLRAFCSLSDLRVQPGECHVFFLTMVHDSYTVNNYTWRLIWND